MQAIDGSRYAKCTRAQAEIFNGNRLAGPGHTDAGDFIFFQFGKAAAEDAWLLVCVVHEFARISE